MSQTASQERSRNYTRQIKGSILYRGLAVGASFLAIPLMIRYLGQEQFGVWSTLLSVMSWIVFFDLGIGNGLRNKLAEALARGAPQEALAFVSSGYSLIGLISLCLFGMASGATFFIPWQTVFNTRIAPEETLRHTVQIALFFILLNFWIGLINQVLNAVQRTSLTMLGQLLSNAFALAAVFILIKTSAASLIHIAVAYGMSLLTANLLLSAWFYRERPELRPRPALDIRHITPLMSLGLQFFTIQLAALVIFTTDKILITQLFGPQYVTGYDVVFKFFSVITLAHALITAPLWSSYTDAYHRGDFAWIRATLNGQLKIFAAIVLATILLGVIARPAIALWIGNDLEVPMPLVVAMGAFVIVSAWNNIYAYCVNGIGAIRPQLYTSIAAMLINIPVALLLTRGLGFGIEGIVMATTLSLLPFFFVGPLQIHNLLFHKKAPA